MKGLPGVLWVLAVLACWGPTFAGDGSDYEQDPRTGGTRGRLRYRIARGPDEQVETPDVVSLKDGRTMEAYFLEVYGDWLVFYVKETERSWLKEEVPRSEVKGVEFHQYLDRDPLEPRTIERASKQPVLKDDILSGAFTGKQGRYTDWSITFRSEIEKFRKGAEDATEYGSVEVESRFYQEVDGKVIDHGIRARGSYYLYAPGTVNNKEWVLVLAEMVHSEIDRSPEKGWYTESIPDETFILYFSPQKDSFRLEWSNVGEWSWTPLVGVRLQRSSGDGEPGAPRSWDAPDPAREDRGSGSPSRSRGGYRIQDDGRAYLASRDPWGDGRVSTEGRGRRWQVDGWKRPRSSWNGRR